MARKNRVAVEENAEASPVVALALHRVKLNGEYIDAGTKFYPPEGFDIEADGKGAVVAAEEADEDVVDLNAEDDAGNGDGLE